MKHEFHATAIKQLSTHVTVDINSLETKTTRLMLCKTVIAESSWELINHINSSYG